MAPRRRAAAKVEEAIEELEELEDVVEELEDADDLEELEEEEPEPVPAKKAAAKKAVAKKTTAKAAAAPASDRSEFDSNWLAAYVTEETGLEYDGRAVRMLLRKLAKDGQLAREIGTDRSRYDFPKGANDATVRQVIRLVKSGEAKAVQQEGLATAKASAAKKAAPAKTATKTAPAKAAPAKATTTRRRTRVAE